TTTDAPESNDYDSRSVARRETAQGGGEQDLIGELPDEDNQGGYEFSGGGRGHKWNRSFNREADDELTSGSGPYTRAGQPALASGQDEGTVYSVSTDQHDAGASGSKLRDTAKALKRYDEKRDGFPGEHAI